jgi:hypothetical protein
VFGAATRTTKIRDVCFARRTLPGRFPFEKVTQEAHFETFLSIDVAASEGELFASYLRKADGSEWEQMRNSS